MKNLCQIRSLKHFGEDVKATHTINFEDKDVFFCCECLELLFQRIVEAGKIASSDVLLIGISMKKREERPAFDRDLKEDMKQCSERKYTGSGGQATIAHRSRDQAFSTDGTRTTEGGDRGLCLRSEFDVLQRALLRGYAQSVGMVVLIGCAPYQPYYGTSIEVVDNRLMSRAIEMMMSSQSHLLSTETHPFRAVTRLSVADQAREVLAALSLNKSQLAEVLDVSRPTIYNWLDGKEPNVSNARRLSALLKLLATVGISSSDPLNARFVRQALDEHGTSLLDALRAKSFDERLVSLLREAKALGEQAQDRLTAKEERLRGLGFEELSGERRRDQLARNVALRDWPKT